MNKVDRIQYCNHVLSYIDILGFKSVFEKTNSKEIDKVYSILKSTYNLATKYYFYDAVFKKDELKPHKSCFVFSDLIIRTIRARKSKQKVLDWLYFMFEISDLSKIQLKLIIDNNILIRGAITYNKICVNKNESTILGNGLIEAHLLENNIAKYPRIIISPRLIYKMKNNIDKKEEYDIVNMATRFVEKDSDGIYYIDYIYAYLCNKFCKPHKGQQSLKELHIHKLFIQNKLREYDIYKYKANDTHLYQKYYWMKECHNKSINKMIKLGKMTIKTRKYKNEYEKQYVARYINNVKKQLKSEIVTSTPESIKLGIGKHHRLDYKKQEGQNIGVKH